MGSVSPAWSNDGADSAGEKALMCGKGGDQTPFTTTTV